MLQNLTNGLLKSTSHRVVNSNHDRERRFSMPFFVHPRSEVSLTPLTTCVNRMGGTKNYPDLNAGEYLEHASSVFIVPATASSQIVLIRTYRYNVDGWVWKISAGGGEVVA